MCEGVEQRGLSSCAAAACLGLERSTDPPAPVPLAGSGHPLQLPDLPDDALVAILAHLSGYERRGARALCRRLRQAVNLATTRLRIDIGADATSPDPDPDPLVVPSTVLPHLRTVELYAYKPRHEEGLSLRSLSELRGLGLQDLPRRCVLVISLRHERCSLDLSHVVAQLREAGLWERASRLLLRVDGWHGPPVDFQDVEVHSEVKVQGGARCPLPRILSLPNLTSLSILSTNPDNRPGPDWRQLQRCAGRLQSLDFLAAAPLEDVFGQGLTWGALRSLALTLPVGPPRDAEEGPGFDSMALRALAENDFPQLQRLKLRFEVSSNLHCCVPDLARVLQPLAALPLADLEVIGDIRGFQGLEKLLPRVQRLALTHSCPAVQQERYNMHMGPQLAGDEFSQLSSLRDLRLTNIRAARGLAVPPRLHTLWVSNLKLVDVQQLLAGLMCPAGRAPCCEVCVHFCYPHRAAEGSKYGDIFGVPGWSAKSALVSPDGHCQKYVRLVRC
eukprot:jgi/Botrbrau1/4868/Bobra.0032s0024.1